MKSEKGDDTGTAVLTGRKIERLRTVIGISQAEFGQRMEASPSRLYPNWNNHQR